MASLVKPDTILAWHRKLVMQKFDGSKHGKPLGCPRSDPELEEFVLRLARENRSWGYDRIVGALKHLGYTISDQTVDDILKRHGMQPAPERKKTTTWKEFIRSHMDILVVTDFFTTEVWTWRGLVTGVTPHPNTSWMKPIARNEAMDAWGFLKPSQYLIHDRDGKYCPAFQDIIDHAGINRVLLPPHSPDLNAFAERWVRSVKEEVLLKLILFGERALRHTLKEYTTHFHTERPHQGIGNVMPFPASQAANDRERPIQCHERLGGVLTLYDREAA